MDDLGFILSGLIVAGALCQWISWWIKVPSILFLLLIGILVGPTMSWLDPDALLGDLLFPFVSLSVAIILFEGSLTLDIRSLKDVGSTIRNLITIGALLTGILAGFSCYFVMGASWEVATLFGCIMTVSGPTVIIPMLRSIQPTPKVSNILRWEGILIDPIGATATVLLFDLILAWDQGQGSSHVLTTFLLITVTGSLLGVAAGWAYGMLLRHHLVPEYLQNVTTLGLVCFVFSGANLIEHESGILAVTVMGIVIANFKNIDLRMMTHFKESLSMILISSLFILLAAKLNLQLMSDILWKGVVLCALIQFVIRPLAIFVSARGSSLKFGEKVLLSWITPKGIVAAAVASFFGWKLEQIGVEDSQMLVVYTFMVIIGTVSLECLTARWVGKKVGACETSIRGILISGSSLFARDIGTVLKKNGFRVILADTSLTGIQEARMSGLDTYLGNPVSNHANTHLNLVGIGKLLALKQDRSENTLTCLHYIHEFGKRNVYLLQNTSNQALPDRVRPLEQYRGFNLFGTGMTFAKLSSLYAQGYRCKTTLLTKDFSIEQFKKMNPSSIPLFAITNKDELQVFVENGKMVPKSDWRLVSFTPEKETEPAEDRLAKAENVMT
jgi:CPA1 family monovalent cation:H+ antiporter